VQTVLWPITNPSDKEQLEWRAAYDLSLFQSKRTLKHQVEAHVVAQEKEITKLKQQVAELEDKIKEKPTEEKPKPTPRKRKPKAKVTSQADLEAKDPPYIASRRPSVAPSDLDNKHDGNVTGGDVEVGDDEVIDVMNEPVESKLEAKMDVEESNEARVADMGEEAEDEDADKVQAEFEKRWEGREWAPIIGRMQREIAEMREPVVAVAELMANGGLAKKAKKAAKKKVDVLPLDKRAEGHCAVVGCAAKCAPKAYHCGREHRLARKAYDLKMRRWREE